MRGLSSQPGNVDIADNIAADQKERASNTIDGIKTQQYIFVFVSISLIFTFASLFKLESK